MSEAPPPQSPKKEMLVAPRDPAPEEHFDDADPEEPAYGEARLWIAPRDPHCIFAYWELRPSEHPAAVDSNGVLHFYLRIFRGDGVPESSLEVKQGAGHCFAPVVAADEDYRAEIGFYSNDVWCFIARSRSVRTPRDRPNRDGQPAFAAIPASVSLRELRNLVADSAEPGEGVAVTAARIQSAADDGGPLTPQKERLLTHFLGILEVPACETEFPANSSAMLRQKLEAISATAAQAAVVQLPPEPGPSDRKDWPSSPGSSPA